MDGVNDYGYLGRSPARGSAFHKIGQSKEQHKRCHFNNTHTLTNFNFPIESSGLKQNSVEEEEKSIGQAESPIVSEGENLKGSEIHNHTEAIFPSHSVKSSLSSFIEPDDIGDESVLTNVIFLHSFIL